MSKKKQTGILQLTGPTQNMIIYRKRNGEYGFRKKGGVSAERMASDPNYEIVRLHAKDFGKACKAGSLIKRAFTPMIPKQANSDLFQRLTKLCKAVIKSDAAHERGSRRLRDGDARLFAGFEFTTAGSFDNTVLVPFSHKVDRGRGAVRLKWPAYVPQEMVFAPEKATHCRFRLGVAVVDVEDGRHSAAFARSGDVWLSEAVVASGALTVKIPAGTEGLVFVALGIEFLEEEGDVRYPVRNNRFSLVKLVGVG